MTQSSSSMERVETERLETILAGLEGVTPGPWHMYGEPDVGMPAEPFSGSIGKGDMEPVYRRWENLKHIARLDPETVRSIVTELLALRRHPVHGEVEGWKHKPTGNVFKPDDYAALLGVWQRQFADTHSPEEIAADFVALYAVSPQLPGEG